jgi:hypothetical protein
MTTVIALRAYLFGAAIGILSCAAPASAQIAFDDPRLKTNAFDIDYAMPTNPEQMELFEKLKAHHVLEKMQAFLSPLKMPIRIMMRTKTCGVANADFTKDTITVCYEYFELIKKYSPKMTRLGLTPMDALVGPTVDVFLHELGHGILRVLDVPFFGREEDVADYIATYLLLSFCKPDARRLILGASFMADAELMEEQGKMPELRALADAHSLPIQRFFNRWCMAYGADQELFSDAVELGMLPPGRVKWCRWEWSTNEDAFKRLIEPYIDAELKAQVKSKPWFKFESSPEAVMARPRVATGIQSGDPQPAAATMGVEASGAASQGSVVRPQGASAAPQGASR